MEQVTIIGLDIAKHVFQVHGADAAGHVLFRKRVTRTKLIGFLAAQTPCVVAMEACAGAHYWAREISKLGHRVRLIPPSYAPAGLDRNTRLRMRPR
jgi:transposase